jgi:hypothetical protein
VGFSIRRLYGQSRFRERPLRQGRGEVEFLDSAIPQVHFRLVPAGSPDDESRQQSKKIQEQEE